MGIMEERRIRIAVNSEVSEFSVNECRTIDEVKGKIKAKYETEDADIELFYNENILTDSATYEELLVSKTEDVNIKAILKQIKNLQKTEEKTKEDMEEKKKFSGVENKEINIESEQCTGKIRTKEHTIIEETKEDQNEKLEEEDKSIEETIQDIEEKDTVEETIEETIKEPSVSVDTSKEEISKIDSSSPCDRSKDTNETSNYVKVKDLRNNKEYLVKKTALININGNLYYIKKKKRVASNVSSLVSKVLSKLYVVSTYLLIAGFFTFYMDKLFAVLLLTILALYALGRLKVHVSFRRNEERGRFILKQIVCFFTSLFFNPGYNMSVHMQDNE